MGNNKITELYLFRFIKNIEPTKKIVYYGLALNDFDNKKYEKKNNGNRNYWKVVNMEILLLFRQAMLIMKKFQPKI